MKDELDDIIGKVSSNQRRKFDSDDRKSVFRVTGPKVEFPEIAVYAGEVVGIFTSDVKKFSENFFRIICEPLKNAEKVTINDLIANNSWMGRAVTHIAVPTIWNQSLLEVLRSKPERRNFVFIGACQKDIEYDELPEISGLINDFKGDSGTLVITDSMDLLEALVTRVVNEKGEEFDMDEGDFFIEPSTGSEIQDLGDISCNLKKVFYKKVKILVAK